MHSFTDTAGREWQIELTIGAVKQLKVSELKIDLLKINEGKPTLLTRLFTDIELGIDVIWELVRKQAEERGLTVIDFVEALGGDAATDAKDAFDQELVDFFRQLRRTQEMRAVEKMRKTITRAIQNATERIERIDVDKFVDEAMAVSEIIPGEPSTTLPASSD